MRKGRSGEHYTKDVAALTRSREETFEVSIGAIKSFEVACFDRQLVGKHDVIGLSTFKVDPKAFAASPSRDVLLPLNPRGAVHLRITMEGGEKHDIDAYLKTAGRALDRAAGDMSRCIVDRVRVMTQRDFVLTQCRCQSTSRLSSRTLHFKLSSSH